MLPLKLYNKVALLHTTIVFPRISPDRYKSWMCLLPIHHNKLTQQFFRQSAKVKSRLLHACDARDIFIILDFPTHETLACIYTYIRKSLAPADAAKSE
jgi:hypothetical protein